MNKQLQKDCLELVKKYNSYKSKRYKTEYRNKIFLMMQPWMIKWIKSILSKWGKFESEQEILSTAWDAFYYCLNKYSNYEVPIPKYFHDFTRYYLLMEYARRDKVSLPMRELQDTLALVDTPENILFDRLLTLNQFRDVLPEEYRGIWDDACFSLAASVKEKMPMNNTRGLDYNLYRRLKASYIPMIRLILGAD